MDKKDKRKRAQRARDEKLHEQLICYLDFSRVASFDALYESSYLCQRGVIWKNEVSAFCQRRIQRVSELSQALQDGSYQPKKKKPFILHERGKVRVISPVAFQDRVVQRAFVDNILFPVMCGSFVAGNAASQTGKGPDYSRDRFERALRRTCEIAGPDAWVLQYDFSDYFHSVPVHDALSLYDRRIRRICLGELTDNAVKIMALLELFLFQYEGLGIGNQTSQLTAVAYPGSLDHAMEELTACLGYGRYMDDGYAFYRNRADAEHGYEVLREKTSELGLVLNEPKTRIRKVSEPLCYLKRVYKCDESLRRVEVSVSRKSDAMYERRVKHIARKVLAGELGANVLRQGLASKKGIALRVSDPDSYAERIVSRLGEIYGEVGITGDEIVSLLLG